MQMAAARSPREIGARRAKACDGLLERRQLQIVIAQQLAQSRRVALGRRDEDDFLALPTFEPFDQGRQRSIFAVQRGFLAQYRSVKKDSTVSVDCLRALRSGHDDQRFAMDSREWLERRRAIHAR